VIATDGKGKTDRLFWEALEAKLSILRSELLGPNPSAVERLLADRVLCCWMETHDLMAMWYVGHINAPARPSEQIDRRLTRAHNRYLSALRALAAVRRLDLTLVNVNLGAGPAGLGSGK
jgi:hypothetical protein